MPRWTIIEATALPERTLALRFVDGTRGMVTLKDEELTGALARLRDPGYFGQLRLLDGVPTWPQGEDLAPDGLYAEIRQMQPIA